LKKTVEKQLNIPGIPRRVYRAISTGLARMFARAAKELRHDLIRFGLSRIDIE
jgi:hypothetical protein